MITYNNFIEDIINHELKPYHICWKDIEEFPDPMNIEGKPWQEHFTFKTPWHAIDWEKYVLQKMTGNPIFKFLSYEHKLAIFNTLKQQYGLKPGYLQPTPRIKSKPAEKNYESTTLQKTAG